MKATVLDLRYRMRDILKALDSREKVTLLYHGRVKGVIVPTGSENRTRVEEHPFFGMTKEDVTPVDEVMKGLREFRCHAV